MKRINHLGFVVASFLLITSGYCIAQTDRFEYHDPDALTLDVTRKNMLTSGYWRVFKDELRARGQSTTTQKNISVCYYPDGTFFFNGATGSWKIVEDKYIEHQLDKNTQDRLNFGGVFSVIHLDGSNFTLRKLLTSSHDMQRTLYLRSSARLTRTEQLSNGRPYLLKEPLNQTIRDSLSNMSHEALFDAGFIVNANNTIHIVTPDGDFHSIKVNKK